MALKAQGGKMIPVGKKEVATYPSLALEEMDWVNLRKWAQFYKDEYLVAVVDRARESERKFQQDFRRYLEANYVRG